MPSRSVAAACFALLFLASSSLPAQQTSPQTTQRDPQAVAVLNQMIAATGWSPGNLPQDAVATGTVTRYRGDAQDTVSVTWKLKSKSAARIEVQDPTGQTTTITNGDQAAILRPSGTRFAPRHAALSMRPLTLPFLSDQFDFADPNLALVLAGTETVAGQPAYRVDVDRAPSTTDPLAEIRRKTGHLTLWISTATLLPIQIQYPRISDNNPTAVRTRTRTFSDYRVVNGLAIPFRQEEAAGGQPLYTLQLTMVSMNVGLADAEFSLPAAQQ